MNLSTWLSTLAGLGYTIAYVVYNLRMFRGETKPNGATWAIWSAVSLVSTPSYLKASDDVWMSVIPLLNILLCIGTFIIALIRGKFQKVDAADWFALCLGLAAGIVWKMYDSAKYANAIVQFSIMIGFIPTWRGIRKSTGREHSLPWVIWSISYCVSILVVILRWKDNWIDLFYPINCAILHASVPLQTIITARRKKS